MITKARVSRGGRQGAWFRLAMSALVACAALCTRTEIASAACPIGSFSCGGVGCCDVDCCGTICYDPTADGPCCGRVVCALGQECCGSTCYDPATEICCGGVRVCANTQSCCGSSCQSAGQVCCAATGDVCRPSQGECDPAETCPSAAVLCPPDVKTAAGIACSTDNNPCTVDQCNGTSAVCQHTPGNQGATCRDSNGPCDPAETCTGSSATCPPDQKSTDPCRPAAGPCDVAESCDGVNDNCPTDQFVPGGGQHQCSDPSCVNGQATLASFCSGSSAQCPPAQTQMCSPSTCSGAQCAGCTSDNDCPSTQYCSGGVCVDKLGTGKTCSLDSQCALGHCVDTVCCDKPCDGGICDSCNLPNLAGTCSPVPANTVCREAAGECDVAETCGGATQCPPDVKKGSLISCTDDGDPCTLDQCDGKSNLCQHPAAPMSTPGCSADGGSPADAGADEGLPADGSSEGAANSADGAGGDSAGDASNDSAGNASTEGGRSDGATQDAPTAQRDSSSDAAQTSGDASDTYAKEPFGACTCRTTGRPAKTPPAALYGAIAFAWYLRGKRARRSRKRQARR